MNVQSALRAIGICLSSGVSVALSHMAHASLPDPKTKGQNRVVPGERGGDAESGDSFSKVEDPDTFRWRHAIVTTTFWIGEDAAQNNPVPNYASSWDTKWTENYGGTDTPVRADRAADYRPADFLPGQNPFYVALPYNDMTLTGHKAEASRVIPWFAEVFEHPHKSVLKGRWIAIRFQGRIAYAQWEDCGPFRTDHWEYVFGNERPRPNLNRGAGLDVSPSVRDYLGMNDSDVTDWKFVEFTNVPVGPWARYGDNNTFVQNRRQEAEAAAAAR